MSQGMPSLVLSGLSDFLKKQVWGGVFPESPWSCLLLTEPWSAHHNGCARISEVGLSFSLRNARTHCRLSGTLNE